MQNLPWYEKVWFGVLSGSGNAVGDTWKGIKEIADLFSATSIQKSIHDPLGALEKGYNSTINMPKYIKNAVITAYERDFVYGDAESRTAFITNGLTSLGISIFLDKGISNAGNISKLGNMAAKSAKYILNIYNSVEPTLAGVQAVSKPVPYNVMDDNNLLSQINSNVDEVYRSGKGNGNSLPSYGKKSVPMGPYREVNGFSVKVKAGAQEKHIPNTPNYNQEIANGKNKSIFYGDNIKAQELLDKFAGKGELLKNGRERVDFGEPIGKYFDVKTGKYIETTRGMIHYGKDGAHIVPSKPLEP